jgi:hypothetical protein
VYIKLSENSEKLETEPLAMIRQAFEEESTRSKCKSPNSPENEKGETGEEQSQKHAHHFL